MSTACTSGPSLVIDLELPPSTRQEPLTLGTTAATPADQHIAEAAYFLAQARGFAPGSDLDDWLAAEQQLSQGTGA